MEKTPLEGKKCRRGKNYLSRENTRVYENGKNSPGVFSLEIIPLRRFVVTHRLMRVHLAQVLSSGDVLLRAVRTIGLVLQPGQSNPSHNAQLGRNGPENA